MKEKTSADFAREFGESFGSIYQRHGAHGSSTSELIYRACDVMVSKQHVMRLWRNDDTRGMSRITGARALIHSSHDLWKAVTEANVKEGLEFIREVEVMVEEGDGLPDADEFLSYKQISGIPY